MPQLGSARARAGKPAMTDTELRELCTRYFDAVERRDLEAVAALYAPEFVFWVNLSGTASSREQNLASLRDGYTLLRRRTYDDRRVDSFETGFVARYSVNGVQHDGRRFSLWACVVAQCRSGLITRIDEYLDSSKFLRPRASAT
jgi:ketosteroid isomerase-like protein